MAVTWAATAPTPGVYSGAFGSVAGANFATKNEGRKRLVTCVLTATGTYTAGGDAISPAIFGLKQVDAAFIVADDRVGATHLASGGLLPQFDLSVPTAPKLKLYSSASTETSGSVSTIAYLVRVEGS